MTDTAKTQEHRTLALETPLGADKLLLVAAHGSEALGRLFEFELDLATEGAPIDYTKILGQNVSIRLSLRDGNTRYFNGYISRFTFVAMDESQKDHRKIYSYRATMVPWTWFMTRSADCRIFQDMKVPEIIEKIFRDRGFTDFSNKLNATYRKWEYCVQYRETDFNFISRLMENEGIYYYFQHENGKHTLVLCDAPSNHAPAEGYKNLHFDEPDLRSTHDAYIWDWVLGHEIVPNQYAINDFDPLQPRAELLKSVNVEHSHDPDTYEVFDYPGGYVTGGEGKTYANIRLEELEAQYAVAHGTSSARGLYAGATFTLQDHPAFDPEEYLITAVSYQLQNDDLGLGVGRSTGRGAYHCHITCIPSKYEYRAPRATPKPVVQGPQTAIVVGPSGEEIYTDKYSRVKVDFHWDRDSVADEKSSCWVRVSQGVAGKKWGEIAIPRIGQEVIVDFLEGDPDRPIITGRVYNGDNMPPYALPDNKTISGFKSNSSKGGGGFNEWRFEDKKGDEQIFVHAEKNMDIRVKNDRFETIGNDRHLVVEKDKYEHVKNKRIEVVDVDHTETIKNDRNLKVKGKEAVEITKTKSLKVDGDVTEEFGANHSEKVTSQYYLVADDVIIEGKTSVTIKVGKNSIAIDSGGLKVACEEPMGTFDVLSKGDTTLESKMNANLKATMNTKIEGSMNADFKAGIAATLKGGATVEVGGPMATLKGDAMTTVKGGVVMIN